MTTQLLAQPSAAKQPFWEIGMQPA